MSSLRPESDLIQHALTPMFVFAKTWVRFNGRHGLLKYTDCFNILYHIVYTEVYWLFQYTVLHCLYWSILTVSIYCTVLFTLKYTDCFNILYCIVYTEVYWLFQYTVLYCLHWSILTVSIYSELCALVNKPSGASAGASDLKY